MRYKMIFTIDEIKRELNINFETRKIKIITKK